VKGINGNPHRTEFVSVLHQMGANLSVDVVGSAVGEPLWNITAQTSCLSAVETSARQSPALMDEFPILAVAAALADGESVFRGLAELRVKESDRLQKIAELLRLFGINVEEGADYLRIFGQTAASSKEMVVYDPAFDHRMAMSALILARSLDRPICVKNSVCIDTSFPTFLKDFNNSAV
jgi:3-phosphoshikimate 1-carboxyvinyltransferase